MRVLFAFRMKQHSRVLATMGLSVIWIVFLFNVQFHFSYSSTKTSSKDHLENSKRGLYSYTANTPSPISTMKNPYVLQEQVVCSSNDSSTTLVLVHSATENLQKRMAIRSTWGDPKRLISFGFKLVFLLGKPLHPQSQYGIEHEYLKNKDIVQGQFVDTYHNLSHKAVLGLRWVSEHCNGVHMIVKMDDDVFLNLPSLSTLVLKFNRSRQKRQVMCDVCEQGNPDHVKIHRHGSKWNVNPNEFRTYVMFPFAFCSGYITILKMKLVSALYKASSTTPLFWIDDVYVYGILAQKVGHVVHRQLNSVTKDVAKAERCFSKERYSCELVAVLTANTDTCYYLWYLIQG